MRQQERRDASYAVLTSAAGRAFRELGYERTRVADIVEGSGYSAGAFYFHFENKADCMWQVLAQGLGRRAELANVPRSLDAERHDLAEVVVASLTYLDEAMGDARLGLRVIAGFADSLLDDPDGRERLAQMYQGWLAEIGTWVQALQDGGWSDPERDATLVGAQIYSLVEGLRVHAETFGVSDADRTRVVVDGIINLLGRP